MKAKKGISLIVLVITIIVIIILAGAVILSLNNSNPIDSARKATLVSARAELQDSVNLEYMQAYITNGGAAPSTSDFVNYASADITKSNAQFRDVGTFSVATTDNKPEVIFTVSAANGWAFDMKGETVEVGGETVAVYPWMK